MLSVSHDLSHKDCFTHAFSTERNYTYDLNMIAKYHQKAKQGKRVIKSMLKALTVHARN